jgi:hypothetical protein
MCRNTPNEPSVATHLLHLPVPTPPAPPCTDTSSPISLCYRNTSGAHASARQVLQQTHASDKQRSARADSAPLLPHSLLRERQSSQEPTLQRRREREREGGREKEPTPPPASACTHMAHMQMHHKSTGGGGCNGGMCLCGMRHVFVRHVFATLGQGLPPNRPALPLHKYMR